jgi:hypothetical protein
MRQARRPELIDATFVRAPAAAEIVEIGARST